MLNITVARRLEKWGTRHIRVIFKMKIEELLNELDEEKLLIWHDEDMFEVGYNEAIDVAKQLIEYRIVRCGKCKNNHECSIQLKFADPDDEENWFCPNGVRKEE